MSRNSSGFPAVSAGLTKGIASLTAHFLYNAYAIQKQNSPSKSSSSLLVTATATPITSLLSIREGFYH